MAPLTHSIEATPQMGPSFYPKPWQILSQQESVGIRCHITDLKYDSNLRGPPARPFSVPTSRLPEARNTCTLQVTEPHSGCPHTVATKFYAPCRTTAYLPLEESSSSQPAHQAPLSRHLETSWVANTGRSKVSIWGLKTTWPLTT